MRRKLSLLAAGLLAGATISMSAGSPAYAQDECSSPDPVIAYVCSVIGDADPIGWVNYYYWKVGEVVEKVHCTLWPPCS